MQQASNPDKIEEFGGGICDCYNTEICEDCYSTWCPFCAYGHAIEDAGQGYCLLEIFCVLALPGYYPICTCIKVERINRELGGDDLGPARLWAQVCYPQCAVCQLVRAVKHARERGALPIPKGQTVGAPEEVEMQK
jgi:hypothetical protein